MICLHLHNDVLFLSNSVCIKYNIIITLLFRSGELDLPYPDLKEYIADMNVMMALIINGPV